jgi:hypothetical protein
MAARARRTLTRIKRGDFPASRLRTRRADPAPMQRGLAHPRDPSIIVARSGKRIGQSA